MGRSSAAQQHYLDQFVDLAKRVWLRIGNADDAHRASLGGAQPPPLPLPGVCVFVWMRACVATSSRSCSGELSCKGEKVCTWMFVERQSP